MDCPGGSNAVWRGFGIAVLILAAGCAPLQHIRRSQVAEDLAGRSGYLMGPVKALEEVQVPDTLAWDDGITEDEAATLALWNNAAYQELLADLGISQADLVQAAQIPNPQINTFFPVGPKQWEFALMMPLDVLWLRPRRIAVAQLEEQRVAERLVQDGLNVVRDVRVAHADMVLAQRLFQLAEEGQKLRADLAEITEARLRAGAVSELDAAAIRVDATLGDQQVITARRDRDLARQRLRNLMGIEFTEIPVDAVPPAPALDCGFTADQLVAHATSSRADLVAVSLAAEAACERAKLARTDFLAFNGILPDINSRGRKGFEAGPGIQFSLPVFNRNDGAIARAEADAERLRRQAATLRDQVALQVRQAHTRLEAARQDLDTWQTRIEPQAQASSRMARKGLLEDGVSLMLLLETTRQYLAAQAGEFQAAAEMQRALAELECAVGCRLFEAGVTGNRGDDAEQADGDDLVPAMPEASSTAAAVLLPADEAAGTSGQPYSDADSTMLEPQPDKNLASYQPQSKPRPSRNSGRPSQRPAGPVVLPASFDWTQSAQASQGGQAQTP